MSSRPAATAARAQEIESVIKLIRGQRVIVDSDLARFYGVTTKALNQGVRRNAERFPDDFAFPLSHQEVTSLKSQTVTSSLRHGGRRKLPWVFTEHGVAMLASVLRSPQAVRVNIEIIRVFVRLRRLMATPGELAEIVQLHDERSKAIAAVLREMTQHTAFIAYHVWARNQ